MKKRLLNSIAVISATSMVFGVFSPAVIADDEVTSDEDVYVEETESVEIEVEEPEETEAVPEDEVESEDVEEVLAADYLIDQAWVDARGGKLFADTDGSGIYEIAEDITVSVGSVLVGVDITIDLNGYTVSYIGAESLIKVGYVDSSNKNSIKNTSSDWSQLTIKDSSAAGTGKFFADVANGYTGGGSFTYSNAQYKGRGGCILVEQYSTLTMEGGTIDGFIAYANDGKDDDEGGGIEINNNGKFYFKGGTVTNCSSPSGGGVSINKYCTFEMTGGSICNNVASNRGGGIRINGKDAQIRIYGGSITGNDCSTNNSGDEYGGGGIYVLYATISIKGTVVIQGNLCDHHLEREDTYFKDINPCFKLNGDLSPDSKICLYTNRTAPDKNQINTNGYNYDIDSFICNNAGYYLYADGNFIYLAESTAPEVLGYNVIIGGAILLEVTADLGSFANTNTSAHYRYSYTKNGVTKDVDEYIPFEEFVLVSGTEYKILVPVESACMTSEIDVHVHYGTKGETSDFTNVTIEKYANYLIETSSDPDVVAVAKALLIYGGYAQINFGINTDNLPEVYGGYDFTAAPASSLASNSFSCDVASYSAANMVFLSQNNLKFRFTEDMGTITVNGTSVEGAPSGSYYIYEYAGADGQGISATDYDSALTVVTSDGTFTYSVETYLEAVMASSTTSTNMKNLAMAYYNFAEAVSALA